MNSAALAHAVGSQDALAALHRLTLDAVLREAATSRPQALALAGSADMPVLTFAALDAEVSRVARQIAALELGQDVTALVAGGAAPQTLIATLAAARAGLRTALAPLSFGPAGLAEACAACGAAALIGAGGHEFGDVPSLLAEAAASAPQVRMVASLGAQSANGIASLDAEGTAAALDNAAAGSDDAAPVLPFVTVARGAAGFAAMAHSPAKLAASALALQQALPGDDWPLLSTLAPVTLAGLIGGALAAWLGGRGLILHGPFSARGFTQALERAGRAHVIAPASAAAQFTAAFAATRAFASLTLLHRHADNDSVTPPPRLPALAPGRIVDLHAIGEALALALPRGTLGEVRPLASAARYVTLANQSILAFEARQSASGGLDIWGAAADIGRDWRTYWRV